MTLHRIDTRCPRCGEATPYHDAMTGNRPPRPGDVGVCTACCRPAIFDDEMQLRLPTPAEAREIHADRNLQELVIAAQRAKQARRPR